MTQLQDILLSTDFDHGSEIAIKSGDIGVTYREVKNYASQLANLLRKPPYSRLSKFENGDRVVIFMDNTWKCAASIFGVLLAGGVFVVVSQHTKADKLRYIIKDSGAKVLLTESRLENVLPDPGLLTYSTGCHSDLSRDYLNTDTFLEDQNRFPPYQKEIDSKFAGIFYTSGTTGEPKGVLHTHSSLLFVLARINDYLFLGELDKMFSPLPLNFGYGMFQWFSAVEVGATLILEPSFTYPDKIFNKMLEEEVTTFAGVPTIYSMMISHHKKHKLCFPSVLCITNAAAALPGSYLEDLREIFPNADIYNMYGQTEVIRTSYLDPELAFLKPGSVGQAIPRTETLILDDNLNPVEPGETGMLYVKGPHLMAGYWNQPEKTAEVLLQDKDGEMMLKTGDLFRCDDDGDLFFVSRSDDIIKSRGEKVAPVEVENAIYKASGVQEVVVLGVPDPVLGDMIVAFVVLDKENPVTERQIKRICLENLESYMIPKHILFVPNLVKNSNGKISRNLIREQYADLISQLIAK